jgi:hypothetical protein
VKVAAGVPGDATNEWGGGWNVTDTGGTVLRETTLTCNANVDSTTSHIEIIYNPSGFVDNLDLADAEFEICMDKTGESGRLVTISPTGRPSTTTGLDCS